MLLHEGVISVVWSGLLASPFVQVALTTWKYENAHSAGTEKLLIYFGNHNIFIKLRPHKEHTTQE